MAGRNHHATAVVVGDRGILIRGESGGGKTTLAIALLRWGHEAGRFAALVSDDQVLLAGAAGRLICSAPASIAGLVEVRGRQPLSVRHEASAVIDLVVDLVDPTQAGRFADDETVTIEGCDVSRLVLARRNAEGAFGALASWLGLPPFDHKAVSHS